MEMKIKIEWFNFALAVVICCCVTTDAFGQPNRRRGNQKSGEVQQNGDLPDDPKLLRIHKEFSDEAMKIANEYVRDRDYDSAMAIYGQVLRLLPDHSTARSKLAELREKEMTADRQVIKIDSSKPWQSTGVRVRAGKPIQIQSKGSWTFTLQRELSPEGMAIPANLKDFNLGCLVGYIDTGDGEKGKPFVVGLKKDFVPKTSGDLYLQMYDSDLGDNKGMIDVQVTGTFERIPKGRSR